MVQATLGAGVVGFAYGQEVGREPARHHLAGVDEDVGGKQAEREHACGDTNRNNTKAGEAQNLYLMSSVNTFFVILKAASVGLVSVLSAGSEVRGQRSETPNWFERRHFSSVDLEFELRFYKQVKLNVFIVKDLVSAC